MLDVHAESCSVACRGHAEVMQSPAVWHAEVITAVWHAESCSVACRGHAEVITAVWHAEVITQPPETRHSLLNVQRLSQLQTLNATFF